MLKTFSHK